jgi:hypothetical protein
MGNHNIVGVEKKNGSRIYNPHLRFELNFFAVYIFAFWEKLATKIDISDSAFYIKR